MGFSRQEYWSGLPVPSPGDLPDPGIKPGSPALQTDSLPTELWGKPQLSLDTCAGSSSLVSRAVMSLLSCRAKIWKSSIPNKRNIGYKAPLKGNSLAQKTERKKATLAAKFWKIEGDREGQERKGNEVRELEGLASHSKDFGFCSNCNGRSLEGFKQRNDTIWLRIWKFTSAYQVPRLIVMVQICLDFWLLIHHVVMCWRILLHLHWQWHNVISAEKDTYYTPTSFKNIISIIRVCFYRFLLFL